MHLAALLLALKVKFDSLELNTVYAFRMDEGPKYIKVCKGSGLKIHGEPQISSAFFFVEKVTGNVFKAASWAAPAKGARYNIATEEGMKKMLEAAGPYNGFLYRR